MCARLRVQAARRFVGPGDLGRFRSSRAHGDPVQAGQSRLLHHSPRRLIVTLTTATNAVHPLRVAPSRRAAHQCLTRRLTAGGFPLRRQAVRGRLEPDRCRRAPPTRTDAPGRHGREAQGRDGRAIDGELGQLLASGRRGRSDSEEIIVVNPPRARDRRLGERKARLPACDAVRARHEPRPLRPPVACKGLVVRRPTNRSGCGYDRSRNGRTAAR